MIVFRTGKKVYMMAKSVSENQTLQNRAALVLFVTFTAILWIWILPFRRIDMLLDLAVACGFSIWAAIKLTELIFVDGMRKICQKCYCIANTYDMRMREQRRMENGKKDRRGGYGKSRDAEVDIKYFIGQEEGKQLYSVTHGSFFNHV